MKRSKESREYSDAVMTTMEEEAVKIEPLLLEEEFTRLPSDLAYWNAQFARANERHLRAKHEQDRGYARLMLLKREELIDRGEKLTEALVKATVESSDEWNDIRVSAIEAEVERERLKGLIVALMVKKDALVSIGAQMRAEMGADPRIRDEARGVREVRAQRSPKIVADDLLED